MEKIIEKIRKLLALAEKGRGATEAEAEAAMAKAQALMEQHNLQMATVEAASGGKPDVKRTKTEAMGRAMYAYQQRLMAAICAANYCYVWVLYEGRRASGYRIIGREANVETVRMMFNYLSQAINRVVLDGVGGDNSKRMTRYGVAFAEGCADRLSERIYKRHQDYLRKQAEEAREANRASPGTGNALVVVMEDFEQAEKDLNDDFRYGYEPGTTARKRAEYEAREREQEAKRAAHAAELVAGGMDPRVADLVARGWTKEAAEEYFNPQPKKPETEAQRAKREAKEARENERRRRYWAKQDQKRDWRGYIDGQEAGEDISLDRQIDKKVD